MSEQTDLQHWTESFAFWRKAIRSKCGFPSMRNMNSARKNLAKAIREAEKKLNRPHRHLKALGCVQYIPR